MANRDHILNEVVVSVEQIEECVPHGLLLLLGVLLEDLDSGLVLEYHVVYHTENVLNGLVFADVRQQSVECFSALDPILVQQLLPLFATTGLVLANELVVLLRYHLRLEVRLPIDPLGPDLLRPLVQLRRGRQHTCIKWSHISGQTTVVTTAVVVAVVYGHHSRSVTWPPVTTRHEAVPQTGSGDSPVFSISSMESTESSLADKLVIAWLD